MQRNTFRRGYVQSFKDGKYDKRCFNCSGRTSDEFIQSMSKIFSPEEMAGLFNKNVIVGNIK